MSSTNNMFDLVYDSVYFSIHQRTYDSVSEAVHSCVDNATRMIIWNVVLDAPILPVFYAVNDAMNQQYDRYNQ